MLLPACACSHRSQLPPLLPSYRLHWFRHRPSLRDSGSAPCAAPATVRALGRSYGRSDHALPRSQSTQAESAYRALVLLHLRALTATYKVDVSPRAAGEGTGIQGGGSAPTPPPGAKGDRPLRRNLLCG